MTVDEKVEASKENCNINNCPMEAVITKAIEDIRSSIRLTLGICASAMVGLIIWTATLRADQVTTQTQVTKITNDYTPLIVIQDVLENNDRMISILQIISNSAKDDPRYHEAIQARDKFQREALQRASTAKRGGSSSSGSNGSSK